MSGEGPRGWGAPLYAAVLDATAVGPGTSVLDVGCGAGLFARAAADRGARVTGIDLDAAAVQAAATHVPEGTFAVRHAQDPPSGPFDVVAAVQVLMHVPDPVAVLRALGRAAGGGRARSGGVVAVTVWGREQECDLRVLGEALAPWLGPRHRAPGPPVTEPTRLRAMAARAGLVVDRLDEVVCPFDYDDDDALLGPLFASGLARAVAHRAHPAAVRRAVLRRLEPYRTGQGGYRLQNLFRMLVARPAEGSPPPGGPDAGDHRP